MTIDALDLHHRCGLNAEFLFQRAGPDKSDWIPCTAMSSHVHHGNSPQYRENSLQSISGKHQSHTVTTCVLWCWPLRHLQLRAGKLISCCISIGHWSTSSQAQMRLISIFDSLLYIADKNLQSTDLDGNVRWTDTWWNKLRVLLYYVRWFKDLSHGLGKHCHVD